MVGRSIIEATGDLNIGSSLDGTWLDRSRRSNVPAASRRPPAEERIAKTRRVFHSFALPLFPIVYGRRADDDRASITHLRVLSRPVISKISKVAPECSPGTSRDAFDVLGVSQVRVVERAGWTLFHGRRITRMR